MDYHFQWRPVLRSLPEMLAGTLVTIEIAGVAMLLGTIIAIFLALCKRSGKKYLALPADAWIETARNTPALFQIYTLYFGLGSWGLQLSSFVALLLGITFNNAGYLAETFRGGFEAVPETQIKAARSLGLGPAQAMRYVVIPQMLRAVFHAMTNQMVWSILMSSMGVIVGLTTDLTGVTQQLNVVTYRTFEYFSIAACLYYLVSKALTSSARVLAWRLFRY